MVDSRSKGFLDKSGWCYATGRRKTAVCKVWVRSGTGKISVNSSTPELYFKRQSLVDNSCSSPFAVASVAGKFDVKAETFGGGLSAQSDALKLGISRAIQHIDNSLRPYLKKAGFLTRDPRQVERKKYGYKKARKSPQFSKR